MAARLNTKARDAIQVTDSIRAAVQRTRAVRLLGLTGAIPWSEVVRPVKSSIRQSCTPSGPSSCGVVAQSNAQTADIVTGRSIVVPRTDSCDSLLERMPQWWPSCDCEVHGVVANQHRESRRPVPGWDAVPLGRGRNRKSFCQSPPPRPELAAWSPTPSAVVETTSDSAGLRTDPSD